MLIKIYKHTVEVGLFPLSTVWGRNSKLKRSLVVFIYNSQGEHISKHTVVSRQCLSTCRSEDDKCVGCGGGNHGTFKEILRKNVERIKYRLSCFCGVIGRYYTVGLRSNVRVRRLSAVATACSLPQPDFMNSSFQHNTYVWNINLEVFGSFWKEKTHCQYVRSYVCISRYEYHFTGNSLSFKNPVSKTSSILATNHL